MYIVINGAGKVAEYLVPTMLKAGHRIAVIEINEERAQHFASVMPNEVLVICGDGCDSSMQLDAGMDKADIFVTTTGRDEDNLVSCEIAKQVFEIPRAIARINSPRNERIFRQVGIEAVSATTVIANLIEREVGMSAVQAAVRMSADDVELLEAVVPSVRGHVDGHSGIRAKDVRLPEGAVMVAKRRGTQVEVIASDTILHAGDSVVYACDSNLVDYVRSILSNL